MTTAVLTREEAKQSPQEKTPRSKLSLGDEELKKLDAYWRAANYLSVGQIYLYDNPLLKEPLTKEHIKPRLLGHWGTTPGLNFIYAHLSRVIKKYDLDMIYIAGPGQLGARAAYAKQAMRDKLIDHTQYIHKYGEDMPEILNWQWGRNGSDGSRVSRDTVADF